MANRRAQPEIVRASEIGEYVYCARAWWLHRVQGHASRNVAALQEGQVVHDRHGRDVNTFRRQRRLALVLAALALLSGLMAMLFVLGGNGW
jgi:hypothetical protein